ncbi:MAG: hypothetical protein CR988_04585 [Treponema sp.]|nr:MAG: hypothetical protein CR988_04585 [Treponema sp.]
MVEKTSQKIHTESDEKATVINNSSENSKQDLAIENSIAEKKEEQKELFSAKRFSIKFLRRAMFFFSAVTLMLFMLYVFGNYKGFLDSSQTRILRIIIGVASIGFLFSLATLILQLFYFFRRKYKIYLVQGITSFLCALFGIAMAIICTTIIIISRL